MRKSVSVDFGNRMNSRNALVAMNQGSSMGCTEWVNKDIRKVVITGDWSELMAKAVKSTTRFRNQFYK